VSNFQLKYSNKATANAAQLAKCILLHVYSRTTASSQLRENKQKLHSLFKGVFNPNFRPFSFELKKLRFFEINFELGFKVL